MRSTKPKDFRSLPSANIDAQSRPTLCTARHQNTRTRVTIGPLHLPSVHLR
jgi:hypothetical protein